MYQELSFILIALAQKLYGKDELNDTNRILDYSTFDLCLSQYPWAEFRELKAENKLHTLMALQCAIPTFINISDGKMHDLNILDMIPILTGSIYIMDRGYLDFERLYYLHSQGGRFVIRARKNLHFYRKYSTPGNSSSGLLCDQIIGLTGYTVKHRYPESLRRVRLIDKENNQDIVLLTNITKCNVVKIAGYFKSQWFRVIGNVFFKWIKQILRIKAFY